MSTKNAQRFPEKAETTPESAKKQREPEESHTRQSNAVAGESGTPLTRGDFTESAQTLSDEQMQEVSAGYCPAPTGIYF